MAQNKPKALTDEQMDKALALVAGWLGPKMGYGKEAAPTGREAAMHADGPMLDRAWTWPDRPTPTILLEGGPYDWAIDASMNGRLIDALGRIGVHCEPYAGYALCLYPAE